MKRKIFLKCLFFAIILMQVFVKAQFNKENPKTYSAKNQDSTNVYWISKEANDPDFAKPEYNDSGWKEFEMGSKEIVKENKVFLFRSYIKVDSTLVNKPLQIEINQLGASEIFLDGKKIDALGEISNGKVAKYAIKKNNPILISLGDTNPHVLAIRYYPFPFSKLSKVIKLSSNIINVELIPATDYFPEKIEKTDQFHKSTMLIAGFFLALAFIHLLLFAFYRKAIYNLYFALYNLSISFLTYLVLVVYKLENPLEISETTFKFLLGLAIFSISLSGFINTLFAKRKLRFKVLLVYALVSLSIFYFSESISGTLIAFLFIFVLVESVILIIRAMIRKQKEAYIVGGGILTFLFYVIVLIFTSIFNFSFFGYQLDKSLFSIIVLMSFPISISAYLAWQFASTNISLRKQLDEVNRLSEVNLKQEQEKQQILQNQNDLLEKQVDERTQELQIEKQKTENLLLNILPEEVAEELKENGSSEAKYYDEVSVLFTDFVNFTQNSEKMGAEKMLKELNECFTAFDLIMEKHGLEKIKTIGDAYMAVCGLPHANHNHAYQTVLAGLDILKFIENRKISNPETLDIRIGVNSGSLIAGIVGVKKFAYDIWGDTVNTAARMEQNSEKGKINISDSTYQLIKEKIDCQYRGKIETKGKGEIDMYFALNIRND